MSENNQSNKNDEYFERLTSAFLKIGFVALLLILSFLILKPFLVMVMWAIIIAVIGIYPIFRKLSSFLGDRDKLATILLTTVILAVIIFPSVLLIDSTIESIQNISSEYEAGTLKIPPPGEEVAGWPIIGQPIYEIWELASTNLEAAVQRLEPQIREYGPKVFDAVAGIGGTLFLSILSIIIAGVLLLQSNSAEKMTQKLFQLLIGKDGEEFTHLASATISSVVQGILGIALIQSGTSGIVMLLFGIPAAGLWALLVMILAIIQLPPLLILVPVSIYGFSILDTTSAVIFMIISIVISGADTFLKPLFLGRGVDVPMLVILLGAIGGMIAFGILGLFVGAVILALAYKVFMALMDDSPKLEKSKKVT